MKKIKFTALISILVLVCCVFSGCTQAQSASVATINSKFSNDIEKYLWTDTKISSAIISKQNSNNYYFEFVSFDNTNLTQKISDTSQNNLFHKLANNQEYAEIIEHASKYFFNNFTTNAVLVWESEFSKISQDKLTTLYKEVGNVIKAISKFGEYYRELSADYVGTNATSLNVSDDLNNLLNQYKELIASVLNMNLATLDIMDNSLLPFVDLAEEDVEIPSNEIYRLADAFELYVTEYLYQRYMVYGNNVNVDFMNNELLVAMNDLVQKVSLARTTHKESIEYNVSYEYLRLVESTMMNTIKTNRNSVQIIRTGLPTSDSKDFNYKKAIHDEFISYENNLVNYVNQISNLIDLTLEA